MQTPTPKTELIDRQTMEEIAEVNVSLDANSIVGYVGTRFRKHYRQAIDEARSRELAARKAAAESEAIARELVEQDARKRTEQSRQQVHTALAAWGCDLEETVEIELTGPGPSDQAAVYQTYVCTVEFTHRRTEGRRSASPTDDVEFTLGAQFRYPARAAKLLTERDAQLQIAHEAEEAWTNLKREEGEALRECRDEVESYLVEQRLRNLGDGDRMIAQLDELADQVAVTVGERFARPGTKRLTQSR
jgi:hypothetical protein